MAVYDVTKDNFTFSVKRGLSIVVFWADFNKNSVKMVEILEEIEKEFGNRITIVKSNIKEDISIAHLYDVTSIPSILIMKNAGLEEKLLGMQDKNKIINLILKHI